MNSSARGFTLLEIMVTVGIITILTGALIPSFVGYVDNQSLKQAQEQVKNDLRTAQNRALTNTQVEGANEIQSWGILFTNSSPAYQFVASTGLNCTNSVSSTPSQPLSEELRVRLSGATQCIYFDRTGNSNGGSIYVGKGSKCRKVDISPVGLITAPGGDACP